MSAAVRSEIAGSRNFWLDACRSAAIIMVLLSHGRHFLVPGWEGAGIFRIGGFLGVELFFVLSGFLIGNIAWYNFKHALPRQPWVMGFLMRRWLRTLPNYYLFLVVNALLIFNGIVVGHLDELLPFIVFVQNLIWPHPPIFGEAWSLSVEEVFYLLLPLSLLLLGKIVPDKRAAFLTVTTLLILMPLASRMIAVGTSEPPWDEGIRKVVVFRLDALMVGVLASWLVHEFAFLENIKKDFVFASALLVLGTAIVFFLVTEKTLDINGFARIWLFPVVSIGCVLLVFSGLTWPRPAAMFGKPIEACARWSYALYLSHMPVFQLVLWSQGHAQPGDIYGAVMRWGVFMMGSVCVAALVERFFERPILRWRDRVAPRSL